MPSLDMPHHLRANEWCRWREGAVVEDKESAAVNGVDGRARKKQKASRVETSLVDVGLENTVRVEGTIPVNARVTLDFGDQEQERGHSEAAVTYPTAPREIDGYYWGYTIRRADSLSAVLTECTFEGGYDYCIGTSERGESLQDFLDQRKTEKPGNWQHLLLVFGGVAGLEVALQHDSKLNQTVDNPKDLFDAYVNLVPFQGSRTIRTEEAVWLGCMGLRPFITARADD